MAIIFVDDVAFVVDGAIAAVGAPVLVIALDAVWAGRRIIELRAVFSDDHGIVGHVGRRTGFFWTAVSDIVIVGCRGRPGSEVKRPDDTLLGGLTVRRLRENL